MVEAELVVAAMVGALLGAALGLFAGLVPGLHTNNISQATVAGRAAALAAIGWVVAGAASAGSMEALFGTCGFLIGVSLGHSFTDEIPAVFLGAPDPETALSVLPGHRLLMSGQGASAVKAAAAGSVLGVLFSLPLVPLLAALMGPPGNLYASSVPAVPFLLMGVAGALVVTERGRAASGLSRRGARGLAVGLLLASGALGELVVFDGAVLPNAFPLGPPPSFAFGHMLSLFAGLFGLPTLLIAARTAAPAPPAPPAHETLKLARRRLVSAAALGTASGAAVGWLPGVGAAQAAVLAKFARDARRPRPGGDEPERDSPEAAAEFLVMQSAVAAANLVFNLVALFSLLRVRSGTMAALGQLGGPEVARWGEPSDPPALLVALVASIAVALPLCYAGALVLGRACARGYRRVPPRALAACVFAGLFVLVLALEGVAGTAIAFTALALGLVPPLAGVKRVHLMGAILVPVALRIGMGA